ncbi:hypothetical protein FHS16_005136 [Paenibacillus endophyticus]|uniref:Uncharacterized protein n=1 Tax=Paenibacillus endophyticus TaxID=1294268 RepID=A0A7W5CDT4_9BACL|nr:hypothetical protein [Paenibacillus endophyticus]MBB3155029.1 hypothetical protein [Paenibacillus endophyticus]
MNISHALKSLALKRPIFHNEADFQHALAWELKEIYNCKVRLEQRIDIDSGRRTYLDILLEMDGRRIAIELKYKMRAVEYTFEGESFSLLNQGAQDIGRYDILKDLQRLERMVEQKWVDEGYLIYLTNDSSYFLDPGIEKLTVDRDFRVHEGRRIMGSLSWSDKTGTGTMKGREESIVINGSYIMSWGAYSRLNDLSMGTIRSLIIPVTEESLKRTKEVDPQPKPELVNTLAVNENPVMIESMLQLIPNIPISQADVRDKLNANLLAAGYRTQINRDVGKSKVDIWTENGNAQYAIEVRYKTAELNTIFSGQSVHLKRHAAQDISRYDFLKDVEKLEMVVAQRPGAKGYAILLTNDRNYWEKSKRLSSVDEDFRIHQGRIIHGQLSWKNASGGTIHNREEKIMINGHYRLDWKPFKILGSKKNELFQMLIIDVK